MLTSVDGKDDAAVAVNEGAWPSAKTGWYAVGILAAAQAFSGLDRSILNILVQPIKQDIGASDAQMGLLLGFAFAIFYTTMALPMGRLADSRTRRNIIAVGMTFWCFATAACGLASNYVGLFLARMGVGVGEAALNPAALSLISDYFPPKKRAGPFSTFLSSHAIGSALALFAGGWVLQYFATHDPQIYIPFHGLLRGWQAAFLLAALPGFVVAALVLTLKEPTRKSLKATNAAGDDTQAASTADVLKHLWTNRGVYVPLFGSIGALMFVEVGRGAWAPTFYLRTFGLSHGQVGMIMGTIALVCPPIAAFLCGTINERLARNRKIGDSMMVTLGAILLLTPFMIVSTLVPTVTMTIALMIPQALLGIFPLVMGPAAIALVAPNRLRGTVTAVYLLSINFVGYAIGPTFVGWLSDSVFTSEEGVRYSMALVSVIGLPISILLMLMAIRTINRVVSDVA